VNFSRVVTLSPEVVDPEVVVGTIVVVVVVVVVSAGGGVEDCPCSPTLSPRAVQIRAEYRVTFLVLEYM
jgi:hypothetical protein